MAISRGRTLEDYRTVVAKVQSTIPKCYRRFGISFGISLGFSIGMRWDDIEI